MKVILWIILIALVFTAGEAFGIVNTIEAVVPPGPQFPGDLPANKLSGMVGDSSIVF